MKFRVFSVDDTDQHLQDRLNSIVEQGGKIVTVMHLPSRPQSGPSGARSSGFTIIAEVPDTFMG
jgi:hypothetical protein